MQAEFSSWMDEVSDLAVAFPDFKRPRFPPNLRRKIQAKTARLRDAKSAIYGCPSLLHEVHRKDKCKQPREDAQQSCNHRASNPYMFFTRELCVAMSLY